MREIEFVETSPGVMEPAKEVRAKRRLLKKKRESRSDALLFLSAYGIPIVFVIVISALPLLLK